METTVVTLAVIVLVITSLIIFIKKRNKRKEKEIFSTLQQFANTHNGIISTYNHWDKTMIGLDYREMKILFFIRKVGDKELREAINLAEVKDCRLLKVERSLTNNGSSVHVIDEIKLVFSFINTRKSDISLEFYNNEYDHLTLAGELQLAQKWSEIVRGILSENKKHKGQVKPSIIEESNLINQLDIKRKFIPPSVKSKVTYSVH